jgi:hypothetical protein
MKKDGLAPPPAAREWTRIDDYLIHMRRRDAASRSKHRLKPRTEPETPRFMLSTFPFVALISIFGIMTIAMLIIAWPGNAPAPRPRPATHELGTAPKGWMQEARREMR